MSAPWQPAREARGLLLVHAEPTRVAGWVRRGLVACHVVPLGAWTALVPSERVSRARKPYDNALTMLTARPVPGKLRPALGFMVVDGRAVVTVHRKGWRAGRRWLVWEPGRGIARTPDLPLARPHDLASAARNRAAAPAVARVVRDRGGAAERVLADLMSVLDLPGVELLTEGASGRGAVAAPSAQTVARFEAQAAEEARHRAELEEG